MDPLARERVDEAGGVTDQEPARPGRIADPVADRRRPADRGEALRTSEPARDGRESLDGGVEPRARRAGAVDRERHPDVQLAAGVGAKPT